MDEFKHDEKLFRAVYPPEIADLFWRADGTVSSAAFADPKGLSVDRQGRRSAEEAVAYLQSRFQGRVLYVRVRNCMQAGAVVRHVPSHKNPWHSEIHGSDTSLLLSRSQRRYLSRNAVIVGY